MTAPGDFHLPTAGWFYGIWICLFLILVILIVLIVAKKYTDKNWEEKGSISFLPVAACLYLNFYVLFMLLKYLSSVVTL